MTYPTRYPGALWLPVEHSSPGMVLPPRGLIPHVQMGRGSLLSWFANATSGVSSHLWVGRDGDLEQYVDLTRKAWAQAGGNPYWISAECEGLDTEDYTPAQIARLAEIYRWGMGVYAWPAHLTDSPAGQGLGTHRMGGAGWGGHSCPGDIRANRRGDILAAALARPTTAPPTEEDDVMTPEQEARLTAAIAAVPDAMNKLMTTLMRQAVTGDPPRRMADVLVGSMPEALGLLLLRSSDEGQALTDLGTHVTAIEAFLSGDFATWSATQEATIREIRQAVAGGLPAGADSQTTADIITRLDALAGALAVPRTYTVTPGGVL